MEPRRPQPSSAAAAALRQRLAVAIAAGLVTLLWALACPPLLALPRGEWSLYQTAALLMGLLLCAGAAVATRHLGAGSRPAPLLGLRLLDEVFAALVLGALAVLLAGAFALLWRMRAGSSWAVGLFAIDSSFGLAGALLLGFAVHALRAPEEPEGIGPAAAASLSLADEGAAGLPYALAMGAGATGFILSGWLLCAGYIVGHTQEQSRRRSFAEAEDVAALVAAAALYQSPQGLEQAVHRIAPVLRADGGFLFLLGPDGQVLDADGRARGRRVQVEYRDRDTLCSLVSGAAQPVPCSVRELAARAPVAAAVPPRRVAVAVVPREGEVPFALGFLGGALLLSLLGLLLGRAGTLDTAQDLLRLADDIDGMDGSRGARGLLAPGSASGADSATAEIEQLGTALLQLRAHLFDEVSRYEKALLQAEDADRRKTEFIGDVGRELRAPLQEIQKDARHLLDGDDGVLSEKQRDDVQIILQGAQHLLELLRDVLDASVLAGGLRLGKLGPVDVAQAARDLLRSMRPLVNEQLVRLRLSADPQTPPAHADGQALRRILGNLLSNAVKFTQKGEILVEIYPLPEDRQVRVRVHDTGPGIPSADLSKLFADYIQLGGGRERLHGLPGIGLGLSIARRLCALHGGTIDVESTLGKGSIFSFTLPAEPAAAAAGKAR